MVTIDRSSGKPIQDQIAEQLRFQIVSGRMRVGEMLPSTRALGEQLGVSFHTVRKAFQQLESEGLVEARSGSGYRVQAHLPPARSVRIERGGAVVQEALQRLIGLGLDETEIEYLLNDQLELLASAREEPVILFAARVHELAELCAEQLSQALHLSVEFVTLDELPSRQDADYVVTAFPDLRAAMKAAPHADVLSAFVYWDPVPLDRMARLLDTQTLGLITRNTDSIPLFMNELREATRFEGQVIAVSAENARRNPAQLAAQIDLLLYTPLVRRRIQHLIAEGKPHTSIAPVVSKESIEHIRQSIPV